MTRNVLFISVVFLLILACKKTVVQPKDITGKWRWYLTYPYSPFVPVDPLTPATTGINETISFYADKTWSKRQNNVLVDTGGYSTGHESRRLDPWSVAQLDSIQYYRNGTAIAGKVDYYYINADSLYFDPNLAGVGPGDAKWLIRQ